MYNEDNADDLTRQAHNSPNRAGWVGEGKTVEPITQLIGAFQNDAVQCSSLGTI